MELWDAYNPDGTISGKTLVRGQPVPPEYRHAVVEIFLMHEDGSILLMQRDWNKPINPGLWESSAAGSVLKGESFEEGAKRELLEETGLTADYWELINSEINSWLILKGYLAITSAEKDSVRLQEGETINYRWVTGDELLEVLRNGKCMSNRHGQLDELIRTRIMR